MRLEPASGGPHGGVGPAVMAGRAHRMKRPAGRSEEATHIRGLGHWGNGGRER